MLLVAARLARFDLRRYLIGAFLWLPVSVIPLAGGLLLKEIFDLIGGDAPAALEHILVLCAVYAGVELLRGVVIVVAWSYGVYWWNAAATLLRANVLRSILTAPGPAAARLPHSSGEAVARMRDDVSDVVELTDESVPLAGMSLFGVAAVVVMASIDPVLTLALIVPMILIALVSRLMGTTIARLHGDARARGAAVASFVGELFSGVLAVKTAGAETAALHRLRHLNRRRRDADVKDRVAIGLLHGLTVAGIEVGVGLVLLLTASSMRRGDFTVGDFALFTAYVGWMTGLPRVVGAILYRIPQSAVGVGRLTRLMAAHEDADHLSRGKEVHLTGPPPPVPASPPRHHDPLEVVEARGVTVRLGVNGGGLHSVDLRVTRGSFTVVTGAVGSGKTTLVRALLGLVPLDAGTISWNGVSLDDPGSHLVPGRAAYAGQVPRLLSASLRENLLLGHADDHLSRALKLAAFEDDLAGMADGLGTVVGPRGIRLSGGQLQRATAARALVRDPDLLVVDDLSSALDVETENLLWERLAGDGPETVLVVSHRRAALERADQVVVLDRGRVAGSGPLKELLRTCPEMRRLWDGVGNSGQTPLILRSRVDPPLTS
ncbi:HlyB/MsbA family ABC transporter [Sinosporangium siamense]|uniref:HlyB/MsbA family ABC transporter n=1 Tax=Sinosporangium siamense TaxID=1367973 RepID=A0A919V992_9ACTN|nr:HlyB/MsbA family ABC transporter [Sinosporangium siamense]